jgi:signal transduction histidine kinase
LYIRYLTNEAFKTILEFFDANEKSGYDLHKFLPEVIRLLKRTKVEDVFYRIVYLNSIIEREKQARKEGIQKRFVRTDYSIYVGIVPGLYRGERRYIYRLILEILFLIVEMDILIKIKSVNEAFYDFSKLQTFILHDTKNLTQFIQTLSYNLYHIDSIERERKFVAYLKESAPALSLRANKILSMLEMGGEKKDGDSIKDIDIKILLENLINIYGLKAEVMGNASCVGEEYRVITIFDNILRNVYEKTLQENDVKCFLRIDEEDKRIKVIISDTGSPIENIERTFEPFYTKKKAGLGIGLFQAKNLVDSMGGEIKVRNTDSAVEFEIILPKGGLQAIM